MKSFHLIFVSLIISSIMMQPSLATLFVQMINAGVLAGLWALARNEGAKAKKK